jgi:two-component sensor histidine kinase
MCCVRKKPCTIRVALSRDDESYLLKISDNGIGLPGSFDLSTAQSLGLKLVNFLSRHQLRAKPEIKAIAGTEFFIRFKA